MSTQRRAGPAAVAAALIGAGLLLYRPRLVPELLPGSRGLPMPPAPALASPIAWTPDASVAPPAAEAPADAAVPDEEDDAPPPRPAETSWRDAPADFPAASAAGAFAAGASPSASAPRMTGYPGEGAPSSAETDPLRAPRGAAPRASVRRTAASSAAAPSAPAPKRAPLFSGPAPGASAAEGGPVAVDAGGGGGRRSAAWGRRATRGFPLFHPPARSADFLKRAASRPRKVRPLLLAKLLGRGALRPPPASLKPPDLSALKNKRPLILPGGAPVPLKVFELDRIEDLDPRRAGAARDRRRTPHWDAGPLWHDEAARGVVADSRFLWLWKDSSRWWAAPDPADEPLLRHQGLWWSKRRGVWFVLHDGELWSWRRLSEWDQEGLIRLGDGVQLVYSADFAKVAVITPEEGAVLYDAATGEVLGEWLESELPRRRPRAPSGLRWPRGI